MAPRDEHHESPQVSSGRVAAITAGILLILALVAFGFQPVFRDRIGQTFAVRHAFPAPAVIPNERDERRSLQARQQRDLNGGSGRMPVEEAMKRIAAEGSRGFDPIGDGP